MTSEMFLQLSSRLKREEGFRQFPYQDSLGILTIGYGRNLVSRGISEEEASFLLSKDVKMCEKQLDGALPWTRTLDEARRAVLVDMCFNIGLKSLLGFKNTLEAIRGANWEKAAKGMLSSLWAKQVGSRAQELAEIMRTGTWR
jgi:lysozyme